MKRGCLKNPLRTPAKAVEHKNLSRQSKRIRLNINRPENSASKKDLAEKNIFFVF
jgi:hypothetical protein